MENEFQNKWKEKLEDECEKVLSWERPFLPPVPEELTEKSVTLYIKQIKPQLRRANNRSWRFITWVLVELVFGGLVVLVSWGIVAFYFFLSIDNPPMGIFWHILMIPYSMFMLLFVFGWPLWVQCLVLWLQRLVGADVQHPAELVKKFAEALKELYRSIK